MSERKRKNSSRDKRNNKSKKNLYALLVIVLLLGGGYLYITELEFKEAAQNNSAEQKADYFEVENSDSAKFIKQIVTNKNYTILELSKLFYKNEMFWPYIFEVNSTLENILNIEKNTVIRLPRVDASLLDTNNQENKDKIKYIGDSIMNVITEKIKPKPLRY